MFENVSFEDLTNKLEWKTLPTEPGVYWAHFLKSPERDLWGGMDLVRVISGGQIDPATGEYDAFSVLKFASLRVFRVLDFSLWLGPLNIPGPPT